MSTTDLLSKVSCRLHRPRPWPLRLEGEAPRPVFREAHVAGQGMDLNDPSARASIQRALIVVVETEGPVLLKVAARRVGNAFGRRRVTQQTVGFIGSLVDTSPILGQWAESGEIVLWPAGTDPLSWGEFRVPESGSNGRPVGDIPLAELSNAVRHILVQHGSLTEFELIRETARLFGVGRAGQRVRERLIQAINAVVGAGGARRDAETVVIVV